MKAEQCPDLTGPRNGISTHWGTNQRHPNTGMFIGASKEERRKRKYFFVREAHPNERLRPQEQIVLNILEAVWPQGLRRDELIAAMRGVVDAKTQMRKVLTFAQIKLLRLGLAEIREDAPE